MLLCSCGCSGMCKKFCRGAIGIRQWRCGYCCSNHCVGECEQLRRGMTGVTRCYLHVIVSCIGLRNSPCKACYLQGLGLSWVSLSVCQCLAISHCGCQLYIADRRLFCSSTGSDYDCKDYDCKDYDCKDWCDMKWLGKCCLLQGVSSGLCLYCDCAAHLITSQHDWCQCLSKCKTWRTELYSALFPFF